jgi:hypothetical protein
MRQGSKCLLTASLIAVLSFSLVAAAGSSTGYRSHHTSKHARIHHAPRVYKTHKISSAHKKKAVRTHSSRHSSTIHKKKTAKYQVPSTVSHEN